MAKVQKQIENVTRQSVDSLKSKLAELAAEERDILNMIGNPNYANQQTIQMLSNSLRKCAQNQKITKLLMEDKQEELVFVFKRRGKIDEKIGAVLELEDISSLEHDREVLLDNEISRLAQASMIIKTG